MFDSTESERLRLFCETCDKIAVCRFVQEIPKQSHHIFIGRLPDGRVVDEYPRYDDDDFRAFLTHYRKLRLNDEPTNLFGILKLLKWKGEEADRVLLDRLKTDIKEEGEGWWGATLQDESGDKLLVTQESLEEMILYGEVFHLDDEHKKNLEIVIGNAGLLKTVACCNYLRFLMTVVGCARKTAELIRQRGYLDAGAESQE